MGFIRTGEQYPVYTFDVPASIINNLAKFNHCRLQQILSAIVEEEHETREDAIDH